MTENNNIEKPEDRKNNGLLYLVAIIVVMGMCLVFAQDSNKKSASATATQEARDNKIRYGTIFCSVCETDSDLTVRVFQYPFDIDNDAKNTVVAQTSHNKTVQILDTKKAFNHTWYKIKLIPGKDSGWILDFFIVPD